MIRFTCSSGLFLLLLCAAPALRLVLAQEFAPAVVLAAEQPPPDSPSPSDLPTLPESQPSDVGDVLRGPGSTIAFYFQAEALFWQRQNFWSNQSLVVDSTTQAPILTTHNLNPSPHAAPRITLGYWFAPNLVVEGIYFGLFDWTDSKTGMFEGVSIPRPLQGVADDFHFADRIDLVYATRLNNAEGNLIFAAGSIQWLAGFRYVELAEQFNMRATNSELEGTSDYTINASNHLYGAQAGARWSGGAGFLGWQTDLKAGLLANSALEHQILRDADNTLVRRDVTATDCTLAALVEFNLSFTLQITPVWSAMIGYNVLWIEGLALAPDQVDFSLAAPGGSIVRSDAGIFMHGANVGLVARW